MKQLINIQSYDESWPVRFQAVKDRLRASFRTERPAIEHFGSTAVQGMAAKPIIDILLGFSDWQQIDSSQARLSELGYLYRPDFEEVVPERRFFTRERNEQVEVNLHVAVAGEAFWTDRLQFRDELRRRKDLAAAYYRLKKELARRFVNDRPAYSNAKTPFVHGVLATCSGYC